MTVTEQAPADTTPKETTTPAPVDTSPSVRTVAVAFGAIVATAAGIVAFVAGGWIALACAGGIAAVGGIATVRAKNPRPGKTRAGILATLLGRPRKQGKSGGGSLPWSLTGSQSRRASKASGIRSRQTGRGKGATGSGLKLPTVTNKGRAKKASTAGTGRALAAKKASAARPVAKASGKPGTAPRAAAVKKAAGPGRSRPSTPTKTPAKPATRGRLVTPAPKTTGRVAAKKAAAKPRTGATPGKRPGARPGTGLGSNGGKGGKVLPFKRPAKKAAARPTGSGVRPTGKPAGKAPGKGSTCRRSTPRTTTGAKRLGGRATGGATTKRARRIGTPKMRRVLRGAAARTPNRTNRRPTTGTGVPTKRRLIGTALRVPRRNTRKLTFRRPTKVQARKAKRTLHLRSRLAGRRLLGGLRRSPRWLYAHRPAWLWPAFVPPVNPEWSIPNAVDPSSVVEVPDRERGPRRARTPLPQLAGRRAGTTPKEHATVSTTPLESISEALQQLTNFDPENALEIEQFMAGLGHVFTEFSGNLAGISDRWSSEQPLAGEVLEAIHQVASVCAGTADIADEAHSTFQTAHEPELTRLREPRANEQAWDVTQNQ